MNLNELGLSELVGDRVALFQIESSNLSEEYLIWLNDPQVNRFLESRFQTYTSSSLARFIQECSTSLSTVLLGIRRLDAQRYIGNIKISWDPNHAVGNIGIMIGDKASWGQGMATDAIALLSQFCFNQLGLRKIMAGAYASNQGSIRAFERCGYHIEATLKDHALFDSKPIDVVMMRRFADAGATNEVAPDCLHATHAARRINGSAAFMEALQASNLCATRREDDAPTWDSVWAKLFYQGVEYEKNMLDYQQAYHAGAGLRPFDVSIILHHDGRPCALWPLMISGPPEARRLTSAGSAVLPPVFLPDLSRRVVKKQCGRAIVFMQSLCAGAGLHPPVAMQRAAPWNKNYENAGDWHCQLLRNGATSVLRHDLYIELSLSLADIRARYRKSYRSLINVGLRDWIIFVMDRSNADSVVWQNFKQLHLLVAKRITRSDETWDLQFDMLARGQAFLVGIQEPVTGRLVGCGFFHVTRDEALYATAAYDRTLFEKPLGHVVQQRAVEVMKSMGLRWYRLGERHYTQDIPSPSLKQVAISDFKQGFSTHLLCRTEFTLPLQQEFVRDEDELG